MKKLLFILFLFSCSNHRQYVIKTGTSLFVSLEKDSIVVVADTRSQLVYFQKKLTNHTDSTHKIYNIGNVFFVAAGAANINNIQLIDAIKSVYKPGLSIQENSFSIVNFLLSLMKRKYDNLSDAEKEYSTNDFLEGVGIDLFITGFENSQPVYANIQITIKRIGASFNVKSDGIRYASGRYLIIPGGFSDHFMQLTDKGYNMSNNHLNDLIGFIKLEAKHHDKVDSLVDYAIIKPDNHSRGKNY